MNVTCTSSLLLLCDCHELEQVASERECSPKIDNSGRRTLLQVLQQQVCHVEWSKMVNAHGDFEVVFGPVIGRDEDPGVIDQDMQWRTIVKPAIGKVSD